MDRPRISSSARSIGILTILNIVGAGISLLNSVVTAHLFGTQRVMEVFFAAATLLALVTSLSQTGQLADIFLPMYHRLQHSEGQAAAQWAYAVVLNWMLIMTAVLAVLCFVLAPFIVSLLVPGFSDDDRRLGTSMFRCLLPLVIVEMSVGMISMLGNAERRFGVPEAIGVGGRAVVLVSFVALVRPTGVWSNVYSLWIGQAFQLIAFVLMLRRMGYRHSLRLRSEGFNISMLFSRLMGTWTYVGATQVYAFALNASLSMLPQGSFGAFKYVEQLYNKTNAIVLRPVSIVFFTHISEALARGSREVRHLIHAALSKCLSICTVVFVAALVAGGPLLRSLWGSKQFDPKDLSLAITLFIIYYALTYTHGFGLITRKLDLALGMVNRLYASLAAAQLVSALVVWQFTHRWQANGAIVGIVVSVLVLNAAGVVPLLICRPDLAAFYRVRNVARWAVACAAGYAVGTLVARGLESVSASGRLYELASAVLLASAAVATTLAAAWLARVPEVVEGVKRLQLLVSRPTRSVSPTSL
jgi:putative peptidoglycan lipid II flippase